MNSTPVAKDLVLLGGGHAHVQVIKRFAMRPLPGVRVTLVTRDVHTPYSGMLPGFVSGAYTYDECHIDLARLAMYANARLVHAEALGVDVQSQQVLLPGRPPLAYDVLSINTGIVPATAETPGAEDFATPVKPIDRFVGRFETMLQRASSTKQLKVAVVGGGPAGVELACALQQRLAHERQQHGLEPASITLVSRGQILSSLASHARRAFLPLLKERGIHLLERDQGVAEVAEGMLRLADGTTVPFDECLWCTYAVPAPWVASSGLPLDADGFILVNDYLQSEGGPTNVFAAGDIASMARHPRPKAGVYAVRAGPPLADNLHRYLTGAALRPYTPQSTHLNLISAGHGYAVAVKGSWFGTQGTYLWTLKDWIDRKFMRTFGQDLDFDQMSAGNGPSAQQDIIKLVEPEVLELIAASKMRCGGCGAKIGASVLSRVLAKLQSTCATETSPVMALHSADDAAVLEPPPPGHVTVHTVDFLRSFVADPFVFGRIAANHALSDCHAMGATPTAALAIVVLRFAAENKMEADMLQLMSGALQTLLEAGCRLVGGHSAEGMDESLGFSVYGSIQRGQLLTKGGLQTGQVLILTKPIGTGMLLAASMRGLAKGCWVMRALESMQQSNGPAVPVLHECGATACTDVTGFGLLGHLAEMAAASEVQVEVHVASVPLLPGTKECAAQGVRSSLHAANARVASVVANDDAPAALGTAPYLIDPQTSGGLLASVPAEQASSCLAALQKAGYTQAAVVGRVTGPQHGVHTIRIT